MASVRWMVDETETEILGAGRVGGNIEVWWEAKPHSMGPAKRYVGAWRPKHGWGASAEASLTPTQRLLIEERFRIGFGASEILADPFVGEPLKVELSLRGACIEARTKGGVSLIKGQVTLESLRNRVAGVRANHWLHKVVKWAEKRRTDHVLGADELRSKMSGYVGKMSLDEERGGVRVRWDDGSVGHWQPDNNGCWCEENVTRLQSYYDEHWATVVTEKGDVLTSEYNQLEGSAHTSLPPYDRLVPADLVNIERVEARVARIGRLRNPPPPQPFGTMNDIPMELTLMEDGRVNVELGLGRVARKKDYAELSEFRSRVGKAVLANITLRDA